MIDTLDQRKDEAIERTFKQVSKNFEEVFERLVPVGRGRLIMQKSVDQVRDKQPQTSMKLFIFLRHLRMRMMKIWKMASNLVIVALIVTLASPLRSVAPLPHSVPDTRLLALSGVFQLQTG